MFYREMKMFLSLLQRRGCNECSRCTPEEVSHTSPWDSAASASRTPTEPTWCIQIRASSVTPLSARSPFGAVQTAYIDVKGLLLPIRRIPRQEGNQVDRCGAENVGLLDCYDAMFHKTDLFAPDSLEALERLDSSCYWLPVYYVSSMLYPSVPSLQG